MSTHLQSPKLRVMVLISEPREMLLLILAATLKLAAASHFRGGIIQWRPLDPDNATGGVSAIPVGAL